MRVCHGGLWLAILVLGSSAVAQWPTPIADRPENPLAPPEISRLSTTLSGKLAYFFKDPDGTEVVQLTGEASIVLGEGEAQRLKSREAIVWMDHQSFGDTRYVRLEILLWRDAEITESAGTVTSGPVFFVTLNTSGPLSLRVDEFGYQSGASTQVFQEGQILRKALGAENKRLKPGGMMHVYDPTEEALRPKPPQVRPVIQFQSQGEFKGPFTHEGHRMVTILGRIFLSRGVPGAEQFLEIQADSAVIFLTPEAEAPSPPPNRQRALGGRPGTDPASAASENQDEIRRTTRRDSTNRQKLSTGLGEIDVLGAYLEGDVLMTVGPSRVRAGRLYYDLLEDRAVILDAVVHTALPERNVPLYLRAAEVRQLSVNHFAANDALLTTSEFHTPHYHIGASRVEVINRTPPGPGGAFGEIRSGSFTMRDATLNVYGVPIAYWPTVKGTVDTSESTIRALRIGYSDDFGAEVETEWNLFSLLGMEDPEGFDTTLSLDYFSERGPGIGVDSKYQRDKYFGLLRSYLMYDDGVDYLGNERRPVDPDDIRGRFLIRHREYLPEDWQLSLEFSYISDETFLEEYFENEFDNDKDQETLLYLKKQRDNWAFTTLLQARILDFTTQTERLPDLAYVRIGEPLWGDRLTWYTENRAGAVRYLAEDQDFFEWLQNGPTESSGTTFRGDTRHEIGGPVDLGPIRFVPFAAARGTAWDDSPDDGGLARAFGEVGVRASMYLWRAYPETQSSLFDINGIRHIIKPDVTAWGSSTNVDSNELYPFDPTVEKIDEVDGVTFGVRQRFQTKRGTGTQRRTVDVFTIDTEVGVFNDGEEDEVTNGFASFSRPENSVSHNYVSNNTAWRINDRTAILNEINFDMNDQEVDIFNISLAVERTPRFSYIIGYRLIDETDSNLLALDVNYKMTEKHSLAIREAFDLDEGRTLDSALALIRKHPRWFTAVTIEIDDAADDFGVSFSLWPEGLTQNAIGSPRFTGLASSTSLQKNN